MSMSIYRGLTLFKPRSCRSAAYSTLMAKNKQSTALGNKVYADAAHQQFFDDQFRQFLSHPDARVTKFDPPGKPNKVYANVDTSLNHVNVYGFDYDYTLMHYEETLQAYLYDHAVRFLVEELGYPMELLKNTYDPHFSVRGLYYDRKTGCLLKLDQFHKILTDGVYFGRQQLSPEKIVSIYGGVRLSPVYMQLNLRMMTDLFCLPEACLYADVIELFKQQNLEISPRHVSVDLRTTFDNLHASGQLHRAIIRQPSHFLQEQTGVFEYLDKLRDGGKRLFLLTNSPFKFVDAGMNFALRNRLKDGRIKYWTEYFDVVICAAHKPDWYTNTSPFRRIDITTGTMHYEKVEGFRKGAVYTEGNIRDFAKFTGWTGTDVIYFGDHIYSDLSKPNKFASWKTAAVMAELEHEVAQQSDPVFRKLLARSINIQSLIECGQWISDPETAKRVEWLKAERNELRVRLKKHINKNFGSVFRTASHRTNFFMEVLFYSDVYMSSVSNMAAYPLTHCFYAARDTMPHDVYTQSTAYMPSSREFTPVNDVCPRSGKPISVKALATYRDHVVGFCKPECRDDFIQNEFARPKDIKFFDAAITEFAQRESDAVAKVPIPPHRRLYELEGEYATG